MQKRTLINLGLFLLCNFIGFNIGPFNWHLEAGNLANEQVEMILQLENNMLKIISAWMVGALLSFALFFTRARIKIFFALLPIVLPLLTAILLT